MGQGLVARIRKKRKKYRILVGKVERNRPRGRSRCIWVYNIKIIIKKLVWLMWTGLATKGGLCECCNKPSDSTKCREFLD
jgi:hypothetical protein